MKVHSVRRRRSVLSALVGLALAGVVASPSVASDDRGLGTPPTESSASVVADERYVFREHATANHERVDMPDRVISGIRSDHDVTFSAAVQAVQYARSPRMSTSDFGIDRGIYRYRIYEYESRNGGTPYKTGRWNVLQVVIEWGNLVS